MLSSKSSWWVSKTFQRKIQIGDTQSHSLVQLRQNRAILFGQRHNTEIIDSCTLQGIIKSMKTYYFVLWCFVVALSWLIVFRFILICLLPVSLTSPHIEYTVWDSKNILLKNWMAWLGAEWIHNKDQHWKIELQTSLTQITRWEVFLKGTNLASPRQCYPAHLHFMLILY